MNKKPLKAIKGDCDGREQYISIELPPLSVVMFKYDYVDNQVYLEQQKGKKPAIEKKTAVKKETSKAATTKKTTTRKASTKETAKKSVDK